MNNEDKTKKELISELQELQQENNSLKTLYKDISGFKKPESAELLELSFRQGMDGFFFMMLDEPVKWDDTIDKEKHSIMCFRTSALQKPTMPCFCSTKRNAKSF